MRTITLKIVLTDDNKVVMLEDVSGLPLDKAESQLLIIGMLENLKQHHLAKLDKKFEATAKKSSEHADL